MKGAAYGLGLLVSIGVSEGAMLKLIVHEGEPATPIPCRIHLNDANGKPVRPKGLPFWKDHFVCPGEVELEIPAGAYTYEIERGPEYFGITGKVIVAEVDSQAQTNRLRRLADPSKEGWWSGDLHVHREPRTAQLHLQAEDLHISPIITWWNKVNPWTAKPPAQKLIAFEKNRFCHLLGGEDERDGGALLYFNLEEPLNISDATRHVPSSLLFARQARERAGAWIDIEKPFWWDLPLWIAHGIGDSIGIANNHMHRSGVLDSEAWGKPRDLQRFAGPHGNGLWTLEIYCHLLNCGIRIPPSAGSASGVLPNPVGYNRAYVHVEGELSWEKWWDALRAGRVFVSNGPLLRCRANGQLPGHVFRSDGRLEVVLDGKLDSRDRIAALELVHNGRAQPVTLPGRFIMDEGGWFLVRAIAEVKQTFRFASTGPFYVEMADRPFKAKKESEQFFVDWCRQRIARLENSKDLSVAAKQELLEPWQHAEKFWIKKLNEGTLQSREIPR